jgi:hypothetical protein
MTSTSNAILAASYGETHQSPNNYHCAKVDTPYHLLFPETHKNRSPPSRNSVKLSQTIFTRFILHSCAEFPLSYIPLRSHHIQPRVKIPSPGIARDPAALGHGDGQYRNSTLRHTPENTSSGSGTTNMYIRITLNQSPMDSPDFS